MTIQTINLGTYANDGTGDDLRSAFEKVNANFVELDTLGVTSASNLGVGAPVFAAKIASPITGDNLTFRTIVGGNNTAISYDATTITISAGSGFLFEDLNLNGNSIIGSGNIDIDGDLTIGGNGIITLGPVSNTIISCGAAGSVLSTDGAGNLGWVPQTGGAGGDLDFGFFLAPAGFTLDLGLF